MKSKKNGIAFVVMGIIIVILCIGCGVFFYQSQHKNSSTGGGMKLEAGAEDWNKELPEAPGSVQGIKIPGYGDISVEAGTEHMKLSLVNPEDNPCYFQFTLAVEEDGSETVIYESDLVEPGKAVKEFDVTNMPDAGDYRMLIKIKTFSLEDGVSQMNGAEVATTLHVEN